MVKQELHGACRVGNRAVEAQGSVLTAGSFPKNLLACGRTAVPDRLATHSPPPKQN